MRRRPAGRTSKLFSQFRKIAPLNGRFDVDSQITALVRALSIDPSVLLLDEASASMDATATRQTEALLQQWSTATPGRAAVWTSHDAEQIARVAHRTLTLGGEA